MLRKLFAKLRTSLGSKPAPEKGKAQSSAHPTTRRAQDQRGPKSHKSQPTGGQGRGQQPRSEKGRGSSHDAAHTKPAHGPKDHHSKDHSSKDRHSKSPRSHESRAKPARSEQRHEPALTSRTPRPREEVPKMDTAFSKLGLDDTIAYAVQKMGYNDPTPIQQQAIPVVLAGGDVIGSAQTGTGKTAAFALPIIQRLGTHGKLRCLVLEPTRELALQVEEAFNKYILYTDLRTTVVYGGVGYGKQRDDLSRGIDILAATPGRLLDLMEQGDCSLADVEILVLDEVDRMLDMGFLPDVKRIVQQCPKNRQTLFFTATLPPEIASLAGWALQNPVEIKIGQRRSPAETISHAFYPVVASQKFDLLEELMKRTEYKSVIVFSRTKFGADRIARRLQQAGHTVGVIHADRNQRERTEALAGFKSGKFEVLVATDIAARGLDIAGVSHVINYDVPENPEDYVHRIGRTGRAQTTGDAFTLVTEEDVRDARSIERFINATIERKKLEGFSYIYSALFDENAQPVTAPKPASRLHRGSRR
jgi:ATP-dependent RNA helicase RhlE